jgi:hypothetical protein
MSGNTDNRRLKAPQADKLRRIASDGRRRPADREWAARMLSEAGVDLSPSTKKRMQQIPPARAGLKTADLE